MLGQYHTNLPTIATLLSSQHGACKGHKIIKIVKLDENTQNISDDMAPLGRDEAFGGSP